jgi:phosphoglucosamine mutase
LRKLYENQGKLHDNTLVTTVMSNLALDFAMQGAGIQTVRTHVGDRYVIQAMKEGKYSLGGEQSGHMIFLDHNTTGDGILAALQVLAIMIHEDKKLSELKTILDPFPQVLLNVPVSQKVDMTGIPAISKTVASCEKELGEKGRLVLRYSGTENIARVMIEGENKGRIEEMANTIAGLIQTHIGNNISG